MFKPSKCFFLYFILIVLASMLLWKAVLGLKYEGAVFSLIVRFSLVAVAVAIVWIIARLMKNQK